MVGVYEADDLSSADQQIPDWLVYDSISGRAKTVMKWSLSLVMQGLAGPVVLLITPRCRIAGPHGNFMF